MRFAKFTSKRFLMSIIRQLVKVKAKGHSESNQQLVNIREGSAKDKDINLEPYEQPHNGKVFLKY